MRKTLTLLASLFLVVTLFSCSKGTSPTEITDILSNSALPSAVGLDYTK
jgi:hypothetical protein